MSQNTQKQNKDSDIQDKYEADRDAFLEKKYNLIPLSPKLIDHVRRLDSLSHEELVSLRSLLTQVGQVMDPNFQFENRDALEDQKFRRYLENTLKIHQIFALVDVDFSEVFAKERCNLELSSLDSQNVKIISSHYQKLAQELISHNGLNYVPRERNPDGRMFEHASECRVLIDHLASIQASDRQGSSSPMFRDRSSKMTRASSAMSSGKSGARDPDMGMYFIQLLQDKQTNEPLDQKLEMNIYQELGINQPTSQIVIILNRAFIDLSMKAKGKADLYFHAYFWQEYLKTLNDLLNQAKKQGMDAQESGTSGSGKKKKKKGAKSGRRGNEQPVNSQAKNAADLSAGRAAEEDYEDDAKDSQKSASGQAEDPQEVASNPVDLIEDGGSNYVFMKRLFGLAATMQKVIVNIKKFPFTEDNYKKYINGFFQECQRYSNKKNKYLEEIQRALFVAQISNDQPALDLIEKLLIQLMGYPDIAIRDQAVVLLNMLYDEVDWQLQEAFRPIIRTTGQHFIINTIINRDSGDGVKTNGFPELFLCLAAPSPIGGNNQHLVTWHKIEERNIIKHDNLTLTISLNFGKFWKCGFFDWRLYEISDIGKFLPCEIFGQPEPVFPVSRGGGGDDYYDDDQGQDSSSLAQGRFIVHARGIRDHTFHEVQVDYQNAQFDKNQNVFLRRGTFKDVENSIDNYAKQGVSALYLMGTLQRDNYPFTNKYTNQTEYRKDDASPLAVTSRDQANKMLGGDAGLKAIVDKAKTRNIKIVVDTLARISSTRHHRKYTDLLLHYLTEDGRRDICYGTDGQAQNFEDTAMLNYRKIEAWDLLIDEVLDYVTKMEVDGIHLDNGQAWPQIMEPDVEELLRVDDDGQAAYTPEDFMAGKVVVRNENHGYWNTNIMETYPNPFFIKMTKKIWEKKPNFMFIGECWGGFMFEHRQIIMARSAVIPRMYKLPITISSLFGKRLHKDGRLEECAKENVIAIKKWHTETRKFLPEGTILLQSSTSHQLPYPAHLYGRGTWAAIDILYFMPDVPITFMGEIDGEVYNIGQQSIFQHQQAEVQTESAQGMKKSNSKIMLALTEKREEDTIGPVQELNTSYLDAASNSGSRGGMQRTASTMRLASRANVAASELEFGGAEVTQKEREFKKQLDPKRGYDLSKIYSHYLHRRHLRKSKMVLRYGEIFYLTARQNENHWYEDVLAFARYSAMETMIICTNLSEEERTFFVDAHALMPTFKQAYQNNTVVMVKDCINDQVEPVYYFLREFLELRETKTLRPYRSSVVSLQVIQDDQYIFKKCLTNSIDRMKRNLITGDGVHSEQISILFSDCVEYNPQDIARFANVIGSIQSSFLDKLNISFDKMYIHNDKLTQNAQLSSRLLAMASYIVEQAGRENQNMPPVRAAKSVYDCNQLGEIVFTTPELGRWSTVGGLGVMVDELAIGLVKLGQQVTVISPYYERNRKGQTGYLASDPAGIRFVSNIRVQVQNQQVQLGVHEGYERGVRVVFLHNGEVFPAPYQSNGAGHVVFQLAVFNKACLEYCCQKQIKPSVCVTNDWFTGLMAGYVKNGDFGNYFNDSHFLHICHNLQETYEGRIHPHNHEGDLNRVHGLPRDWFSDHGNMINPSKCALLKSDQWATVSKSYKQELLATSSLRHLLHQKPDAFAFPNGIPIGDRIKKLDQAAPDHLAAKKKIQMKYFNYKELDDSIPLFAFVGRVTAQKGVHLILDCAEGLIERTGHKIQILVGGPANMGEPYSAGCAHKMWHLKNKYPHCFYAAPEEFFTDGSLINRGSDFGLMPSAFEPGGIVQHEFFVGKTPVVAYKTGGLKDSVIEFKWDSEQGSGFTMEHHNHHELGMAIERAINTFKNKEKYFKLRENAFRATMDGEVVCKAWLGEFCRLTEKNFVDKRILEDTKKMFTTPWNASYYQPISLIKEIFGSEKRNELFCDIDQGAADKVENDPSTDFSGGDGSRGQTPGSEQFTSPEGLLEIDTIMSSFDKMDNAKKPQVFMLHNRGPRYNKVHLCGSMDAWATRHEMQYDQFTNQWFITLHLKVGEEYLYKYVINDQHWVVNDEEPQRKDPQGNINNYCGIMEIDLM